jgi:hypothetical protein
MSIMCERYVVNDGNGGILFFRDVEIAGCLGVEGDAGTLEGSGVPASVRGNLKTATRGRQRPTMRYMGFSATIVMASSIGSTSKAHDVKKLIERVGATRVRMAA